MAARSQTEAIREQDTPPFTAWGRVQFSCCGRKWEVSGERLRTVYCPHCKSLFGLGLYIHVTPAFDPKWPKGLRVKMKVDHTVQVGAGTVNLKKDQTLVVSQDPYGILSLGKGEIFLEVDIGEPGYEGPLLAAVSIDLLEPLDSSKDLGPIEESIENREAENE